MQSDQDKLPTTQHNDPFAAMERVNRALQELGRLIASDSFAASFQSLGGYRSALLARIVELNKPPVPKPTPEPPATVEWRCAGGCDHRCRHE
ncbi:hypothetical protein ACF8GD_00155 [Pseudomonas putida]|uniref:hypothetical protein n=1 Tax=Pseudomonas putida TaxID=303 RepID=UPI00370AAF1D